METDPFSAAGGLDEQEEDVCRVCRLEEDEENPMVHPCKCSGSVRFVHPDCLKSWLATSQKKNCEICGYRYNFTKVYPDHIPDTIPPDVYIRQALRYIFSWMLYIYRCWMVMAVWLIVLPLANMGGMRTFGWFVDTSLSGLFHTTTNSTVNATLHEVAQNATTFEIPDQTTTDVLQVVLTSKLGPGLSLRIAKRLWRMYRGSSAPNITSIPPPPPAPAPAQIRTFLFFSSFEAPSPYYIFQGQMLSIALAATIVSLIFLREWYASYNWAQHDKPTTPPVDETIVPEEWVIRRGIAERRYTRLPNGKMIPLSMGRKERKEKAKLKAQKKAEATEEAWTDDDDAEVEDGSAIPSRRSTPLPDSTAPVAHDGADVAANGEQEGGPGPSTLAYWDTTPAGPEGGLHTDEQLSSDIEKVQLLIERAETIRRARTKLAERRTEDVAWKAPELVAEITKGKEKAEGADENEGESKIVEEEGGGAGPESAGEPETVSTENVAAAVEVDTPPPIPADPASDDPAPPPALDIPATQSALQGATSAYTAAEMDFINATPARRDSLLPLKRLMTQLSADLQILTDRRTALEQDARALIEFNPASGESPQYMAKEIESFKVRMDETEAASSKVSDRLGVVMGLTERFSDLALEIEEILRLDDGVRAEGAEEKVEGEGEAAKAAQVEPEIAQEADSVLAGNVEALMAAPPAPEAPSQASPSEDPTATSEIHPAPRSTAPKPLFAPAPLPWDRLGQPAASEAGPQPASSSSSNAIPSGGAQPAREDPASDDNGSLPNPEASSASLPAPLASPTSSYVGTPPSTGTPSLLTKDLPHDADSNDQALDDVRGQSYDDDEGDTTDPVADLDQRAREMEEEREAVARWHRATGYGPRPIANGEAADPEPEDAEAEEPVVPVMPEVVAEPDVPLFDEDGEPLDRDAMEAELQDLEALLDDEDEEGGWAADDWDQILEVIGLVGPYSALIQNLILAIAIMGAAMSTCVLFPMTIGKTVLCVDPIRCTLGAAIIALKISRKLLRWTRYLTDPIIDIGLEITRDVLLKPLGGAFMAAEGILARLLGLQRNIGVPSEKVGLLVRAKKMADLLLSSPKNSTSQLPPTFDIPIPQMLAARYDFIPSTIAVPNPWSGAPSPAYFLDTLEKLGNKSYNAYETYRTASVRIATSEKLGDAVTCLAIGYLVGLVGLTSLAWMGEQGVFKVSEGWKQGLRRIRLSIKLTMFLALELVAFPLGAGALIALCTIPLIPSSSILERLDGMKETAFGMLFITWLIGTMFMYGFAQVLAWCRSYCRPGALYFIRDPHDPKYSPVKEIINRPTMAQFHKLGVSTIMYTFLIWWVFGAVPWGMRLLVPNAILPLRLDKYPIPFDYLFLLIGIPPTIRRIRPQHTLKKLLGIYWRLWERFLRLDHLLYADKASRTVAAPTAPGRTETIIWNILDIPFQLLFGSYESSSTLARVPARDRVHLLSTKTKQHGVRREGMFVLLSERGQPKTPHDKLKMIRQDLIARKAERDPAEDFKIVHLPEKWRTRIHVFILSLLAGGGAFLGLFVLCPIVLGREILKGYFGQVHDGYSFLIGAYTIYGAILAGRRAFRITVSFGRARQRRLASRQLLIKRFILSYLRKALILAVIYGLHPIMKGLVWELRIGLLVRYGFKHAVPVVHLWDVWALGSILNAIELGACGLLSRHRATDGHRMHGIWRRPFHVHLRQLTTILLPEFRSLAISLVLPFVYTLCMVPMWGKNEWNLRMQFRMAGLSTWAIRAMMVRLPTLGARWSEWRQNVIDAEYVVEERVDNYEPDQEEVDEEKIEEKKSAAEEVENGDVDGVGEVEVAPQAIPMENGGVVLVPPEDEVWESDSDYEDAGGVGTGEASEVDLE